MTTLFPNEADKKLGIFVETRLKHLKKYYPNVKLTVIAPIPWFPFRDPLFGQYATYARAPKSETRIGSHIFHPRYLAIPKIGMYINPFFLALTLWWQKKKLARKGQEFDVIDGHYLYPDGVSIALSAKALNLPFLLTARGTDLSLIPSYSYCRKLIRWASLKASRVVTVSDALKQAALNIGIPVKHIKTIRNGVDLNSFSPPNDRENLRLKHGFKHLSLLCVGNLTENKGHHLVIEALTEIGDTDLYIVGNGPTLNSLQALARKLNVADRVHFLGVKTQAELSELYGSADIFILASAREGWANVLLESMACGTPVIATRVWGNPEVVRPESQGILIERSTDGIARAVKQLKKFPPCRLKTRKYAESYSWEGACKIYYDLLEETIRQGSPDGKS